MQQCPRLTPAGGPDRQFGNDGAVSTNGAVYASVAVGTGTRLALVSVEQQPSSTLRVRRLDTAGQPTWSWTRPSDGTTAAAGFDAQGRLLVAALAVTPDASCGTANHQLELTRLSVDGSVDVTYATNGTLRSDCLTSATAPTPRSVVVAEDGRTLVSTWAGSPGVLVASADGTAMTTFAALGTAASSRSPLVAVDGGGYAIGECDAAPGGRLYRLDVSGSANVMFSGGVVATSQCPRALGVDAFGRIMVAGASASFVRYRPDGTSDPAASTAFGGATATITSVDVDRLGRAVLALHDAGCAVATFSPSSCAHDGVLRLALDTLNAVAPTRVLDTRTRPAKLASGTQVDVVVAGLAGLPNIGIGAVVLNITATEATGPGFVTVWPTGSPRPTASNLNISAVGQTIPNLVVVPVSASGSISVYVQTSAHLVVDISGWFPSGSVLQPLVPTRVLDTRPDVQLGYQGPEPVAGQTIALKVSGTAGLPSTGVGAIVMNVTATAATNPGFVTVWPSGQERPTASNLNIEHAGQTIPNLVLVPVGADGVVNLYTQSGTHLVVDIAGWFPTTRLFTPVALSRLLDTRPTALAGYTGAKPTAGQVITLAVAGVGAVPATGVGAVALNVTATDTTAPGYVTVWPSGLALPTASNLNVERPGQTIANLVIVPVGANGAVSLYTQSGSHLVADIAGWFPA